MRARHRCVNAGWTIGTDDHEEGILALRISRRDWDPGVGRRVQRLRQERGMGLPVVFHRQRSDRLRGICNARFYSAIQVMAMGNRSSCWSIFLDVAHPRTGESPTTWGNSIRCAFRAIDHYSPGRRILWKQAGEIA